MVRDRPLTDSLVVEMSPLGLPLLSMLEFLPEDMASYSESQT